MMKPKLPYFLKTGMLLFILTLCFTVSAFAVVVKCTHPPPPKLVIDYAQPVGLGNYALLNLEINEEAVQNNLDNIDIFAEDVFQFGDTETTQIAQVVKDAYGNSYFTGGFTGTITLGSTTLHSSADFDMFVAKLDANNNPVWARMASGATNLPEQFSLDGGTSLAVDSEGNIYVAGTFVKSLTFVSETGDTLQTITDGRDDENLNFELFVAKYSNDGELLWLDGGNSGSTGAPNTLAIDRNVAASIILDEDGYPYVAGAFSGTYLFGEEAYVVGKSDFFLASLDKDGSEPFWVSTTGTPNYDTAVSISVDTLGYLNVLGIIGEGLMELPDSDIFWYNDTGENDSFIISYDVNGEWYFANFIGGGDQAVGNDIATSQNGDFFVTGEFTKDVLFPGASREDDIVLVAGRYREGFLTKYDLQGDVLWAKQFGTGPEVTANKVTTDLEGSVYVLGRFSEFIVFEVETDNELILTSDTVNDQFIAKYDNDGNFLWAKQIESTGSQSLDQTEMGDVQPFITQPMVLEYSPFNGGELLFSGDFDGTLYLDQIAITAPANVRSSFVTSFKLPVEAVSIRDANAGLVTDFELMQNFPNPFNPTTSIRFNLSEANDVRIDVFNSVGQRVKTIVNGRYAMGTHQVTFDGSNLSSGMYFYTLSTGNVRETRKMTLIK
ncbi:MAG: T9SS type A sorting domain-containing protein [Bacteroidetes bacterium]|nr:T9SS type A sorting domain-containing protein [Bacteroidota bacterium]